MTACSLVPRLSRASVVRCPYDNSKLIRAPDKTSAREFREEANVQYIYSVRYIYICTILSYRQDLVKFVIEKRDGGYVIIHASKRVYPKVFKTIPEIIEVRLPTLVHFQRFH